MASDEVLPSGIEFHKSEPDTAAELARRLSPKHLADLRKSGLSDRTIWRNGYYTERDPAKIAAILNWDRPARNLGECLCIPYLDADGKPLPAIDRITGEIIRDANGDPVPYVRVKPDRPRKDHKKGGKVYKYDARRGARNRLYIPAETWAILAASPTAQIVVVEGEKKACRGAQDGMACVGVSGVDNWSLPRPKAVAGQPRGPRLPLPDFEALSLSGRPVAICYDSDAATNPSVRWAEWNLALALTEMGACVAVVRLPAESNGDKNGMDDFLVRHGLKPFEALLLAAAPPTHPTNGACNLALYRGRGGKVSEQSNEHHSPSIKAILHALRREVMVCGEVGYQDMTGTSEKTAGMAGNRCLECGAIATCFPCRYNAVTRWLWWFLPVIGRTTSRITIWHRPRGEWRALREHLNRLRKKHGTPKPDYISVILPDGWIFAIFFDTPESTRLTPATPAEAAERLVESLEHITACPDTTARRWRPVRTSLKRDAKEKNWATNPGLLGDDVVEVAVRKRHGCPQIEVRPGWKTMSKGTPDAQDRADDELRNGPLVLRYLPVRGFASLDADFAFWADGKLPGGLPPLGEMPKSLDATCDALDRLSPGLGRQAWERSDSEDAREVLRGFVWWSARGQGVTHDEVLAAVVSPTPKPAAPAPAEPAEPPAPRATTPAGNLFAIAVLPPEPPSTDTPFARAVAEARRLAPLCGGQWGEYAERQIAAGDLHTLLSFVARMREIAASRPTDRERG